MGKNIFRIILATVLMSGVIQSVNAQKKVTINTDFDGSGTGGSRSVTLPKKAPNTTRPAPNNFSKPPTNGSWKPPTQGTSTYSQGSTNNSTQTDHQQLYQAASDLGVALGTAIAIAIQEKKAREAEEERIRAEEARIRAEEERARIGALEVKTQGELIDFSKSNAKLVAFDGSNAGNKSTSGLMQLPNSDNYSKIENNLTSKLRPISAGENLNENNKGNEIKWFGSTGIEYGPDGEIVRTHARELYYALPPVDNSSFLTKRNYEWSNDVSKNTTPNYQLPADRLTSVKDFVVTKNSIPDIFDEDFIAENVLKFGEILTEGEEPMFGKIGNIKQGYDSFNTIKSLRNDIKNKNVGGIYVGTAEGLASYAGKAGAGISDLKNVFEYKGYMYRLRKIVKDFTNPNATIASDRNVLREHQNFMGQTQKDTQNRATKTLLKTILNKL